tara:strand:+ start:343 stop:615 length:273 start_codon:yes stop_codon:yes gene_type:complete
MKTFKQFNEGLKTMVGLGLGGVALYNLLKPKGKTPSKPSTPSTPDTPSTKVNKSDFSTGVDALKQRRKDREYKKIRVFGDPTGEYSDFFK